MRCPDCDQKVEVGVGGNPESAYIKPHEADGRVCTGSWAPAEEV